jgi:AraC-like DNA-binding protein
MLQRLVNDQTTMTPRQLLSILRLSQALARLRFSNSVRLIKVILQSIPLLFAYFLHPIPVTLWLKRAYPTVRFWVVGECG